jgi:hypothetical protein
MILQNHLSGVVQRRTDSRQLNQHFGAVITLFHHPLDLFQVTDGSGKAVDDSFLVFVNMTVAVGNAMGMEIGMVVFVIMRMLVGHFHTFFRK